MTRTLPCRKSSVPARVVTALGFALVVVLVSSGAAAASGVEGPAASAPHEEVVAALVAQLLCERLAEAVAADHHAVLERAHRGEADDWPARDFPVAEAVVPVCKLVNGWD
ncbi:hypothetical protein OG864_03795 [Streptomyces sp. NBC_00124]|uniref:hypothetical protein n=1 Tax=Streptomyces sp. NBC_00124 TaxID=2975662 RepID=UPI00224DB9C7|nr:hypothetical protein [Streptomyces sp. NBC_00124]MCX5357837.1 hypothetical protein [Streptomyces sp. NBC_00124]